MSENKLSKPSKRSPELRSLDKPPADAAHNGVTALLRAVGDVLGPEGLALVAGQPGGLAALAHSSTKVQLASRRPAHRQPPAGSKELHFSRVSTAPVRSWAITARA